MIAIEFHDRKREIDSIMRILKSPPNLITFVYGPINSGKSSLMMEVARRLPENHVVFYINLRHIYVSGVDDFLRVLFEVKDRKKFSNFKSLVKELLTYTPDEIVTPIGRFPIPKNVFQEIFRERSVENVFVYLENLLTEIARKGKTPVLILDELQKISDVKINGPLIYELFNFFVGLTKELHVCHVFAITSDSLFMERVYTEAMLHGRCRYLLVDDFDHDTARSFLEKYGFSEEEIELTWEYFGGKPVYLVEAVKEKDRLKEFCEEMLRIRKRQIKDSIYSLDEDFRRAVLEIFAQFREEERITYEYLTEELIWCMKNNILFLEPVNELIKPQSRLDLLALRRLLRELNY